MGVHWCGWCGKISGGNFHEECVKEYNRMMNNLIVLLDDLGEEKRKEAMKMITRLLSAEKGCY